MSQLKDVRSHLLQLIQTVNAPLPVECRMLPDGTVFNRNTGERMHRAELNRRYLIAILGSVDIPAVEPQFEGKSE